VVMWRWDSGAFGTGVPSENPEGAGTFRYQLRFPGQYFDAESGLHYNYFRDGYDPSIGRFTQSDPIGLAGGFNTYGYVRGNPVSGIDPLGWIGPQETSFQNEIDVAVASGDYAKLESLLEAVSPQQAQAIRAALSNKLRDTLTRDAIKQITSNSEKIAQGDKIRKVEQLCEKFGGKAQDWIKKKGWDSNGNEYHWYENLGEKVGWKRAGELDPF
jgi:RHS repeat-associated protein